MPGTPGTTEIAYKTNQSDPDSAFGCKRPPFATIGLGNTLIDFAVFTLLLQSSRIAAGASNAPSWLIAVSGSYVMEILITFHESGRALNREGDLTFVAWDSWV
jgi:putative flippase GtrA